MLDLCEQPIKLLSLIKKYFRQRVSIKFQFIPLILAILPNDYTAKHKIYTYGAEDHISYPLIGTELNYRVTLALRNSAWISQKTATLNRQEELNPYPNLAKKMTITNGFQSTQQHHSSDVLAKKTSQYLESKLACNIQLNQLAAQMATNRNNLSKSFKAYFGDTIFSWLRKQRMLHAADLLISTSKSILQISEQVGYQDSNNFSTAFKKEIGKSPKEYRMLFYKAYVMQRNSYDIKDIKRRVKRLPKNN